MVLGHVDRGLVLSEVMPKTDLFVLSDYTIYIFHMPLFFFLSGITTQLQQAALSLYINRLLLIVYTYFLWSSGQLLLQNLFGDYVNYPANMWDIVQTTYAPIGQFWFLYALLICHLIFLATFRNKIGLVAALVVSVPLQFIDLGIVSVAAHHFPFYAIGTLVSQQIIGWRPSVTITGLLAAGFAISAAANFMLGGYYGSLGAFPAACLGIALTVAVSKQISGVLGRILTTIGRLSLPIFVAHVIAAGAMRQLMLQFNVPEYPVLYIAGGLFAGTILPIIFYWIAARLDLLPVFGFALPSKKVLEGRSAS